MKKKVKSPQDLERLALARGASVKVGERHFNTTREKLSTRRKPPGGSPSGA